MIDRVVEPDTRELMEIVSLGAQVQAFFRTRVGQYLLNKAADQVDEAVEKLKLHDIESDPKGAVRLQHDIRVAESIAIWLKTAIDEADELQRQMGGAGQASSRQDDVEGDVAGM